MADTYKLNNYSHQRFDLDDGPNNEKRAFECNLVDLNIEIGKMREDCAEKKLEWWALYDAIINYIKTLKNVDLSRSEAMELVDAVPMLLQKKRSMQAESILKPAS